MRRAALVTAGLFLLAAAPSDAALPRCAKPTAKLAKKKSTAVKKRKTCRGGWWPAKGPAALLGTPAPGSPVAPGTTTPTPGGTTPAPGGTTPAPTGPTTPAPTPLPRRVQVDEGEWYIRPSRKKLGAGAVEINVTNFGEDPHDLTVEGYAKVDLAPGESAQLKLNLPAGSYRLVCSLEGHEANGMKSTITTE